MQNYLVPLTRDEAKLLVKDLDSKLAALEKIINEAPEDYGYWIARYEMVDSIITKLAQATGITREEGETK